MHIRRTAAAVALALLATTAGSASPAQAAPSADVQMRAAAAAAQQADLVQTHPQAAASVSQAAVEAYVRRFDVDADVAREHLATQAMVANPQALFAHGIGASRLSAIWFDNETGEWVIPVTSADAKPRAEAVVDRIGLDGRARVETAPLDFDQLRSAVRGLAERFEDSGVLVQFALARGQLKVELGASVSDDDAARVRDAAARTGADLWVVRLPDKELAPTPATACTGQPDSYCDQLIAGVRINNATRGGWCSAGFLVTQGGAPYYLTAGHCGSNGYPGYDSVGTSWWTCRPTFGNCLTIGPVTSSYWNEQGDAAIIQVTGGWSSLLWQVAGWINWWNQGITTPSSWDTTNTPYGVGVCANGAKTGSSCGIVDAQYISIRTLGQDFTEYDMMRVDHGMCSQQGDSGSPVTRGNVAWASGLVTNGNFAGQCGVYKTIVMPVQRTFDVFGLSLVM
jgi:hypothetical protein